MEYAWGFSGCKDLAHVSVYVCTINTNQTQNYILHAGKIFRIFGLRCRPPLQFHSEKYTLEIYQPW